MPDLPIPIRDNDYQTVRIPLDITSGTVAGLEFRVCRKCGALVYDTKAHKDWHKRNDK